MTINGYPVYLCIGILVVSFGAGIGTLLLGEIYKRRKLQMVENAWIRVKHFIPETRQVIFQCQRFKAVHYKKYGDLYIYEQNRDPADPVEPLFVLVVYGRYDFEQVLRMMVKGMVK
jgi:hypothetical protein